MKISKEAKTGAVALIALILLYFGFNFVKGVNVFDSSRHFYSVYERVDGLTADHVVQYNGMTIGRVNSVEFLPDNSGRILVHFSIMNKNVAIPVNSIAKITSLDLFDTKAIILEMSSSTEMAQSGDTLVPGLGGALKSEVSRRLEPLEGKINFLLAGMDSVVLGIQDVLNRKTRNNLVHAVEQINESFTSFNELMATAKMAVQREETKISQLTTNLNKITGNLAKNSENISEIMTNLNTISDSLAQSDLIGAINKAGQTMENVSSLMKKINNGEGTIGMLVNNDSLYLNLQAASSDLDKLLIDLKENPKRYVHFSIFGGSKKTKNKARTKKE